MSRLIQEAQAGYWLGFANGTVNGKRQAAKKMGEVLNNLKQYPGIGDKTVDKIIQAMETEFELMKMERGDK